MSPDSRASIFVSIASYRDNQCQYTIADLFKKAKHPERVIAGVCFQVAQEDDDSFLLDLSEWSDRIRTYFLHHTEAKGPCHARWAIQKELFRGEDFYFQIDSHFRFVQDWDDICLEQLSWCDSPKPILTTYASSYTLPKDYKPGAPDQAVLSTSKAVTIICADTFGDQQRDDPFLRIKTRTCRSDFGHRPPPALFWTARFAFSAGAVVAEVPYDPHLEYIFFGEEIAMSARLWTSGWDLFNPTRPIAYHLGSRAHRQWFREVQRSPEQLEQEQAAKRRICGLLGTPWPAGARHPPVPAPYGLGGARSLPDYERFAGVAFGPQTVCERALNGGLGADLFAPLWAERERERLSHAAQLGDVASWAGKDNVGALQRQFPGREAAGTAPPASQQGATRQQAETARELACVRVQALQARLQASDEGAAAEVELELGRAFSALAAAEERGGGGGRAEEAYARALEHAEAARERAEGGAEAGPCWRVGVELARCTALLGLRRHAEAKAGLAEALASAVEAVSAPRGCAAEQLAHDVVEAVHRAHEKTDDRRGLESFATTLRRLLAGLRAREGQPGHGDGLLAADDLGVRAQLLERIVLICVATGREEDAEVAKSVFRDFGAASTNPNLKRLLGILESHGLFVDP